ncbi:MAG: DUF1566 domain-containing protein [Gammaproteobacteria bacterium]|nr:DUF1566 domain-containing protein [Gammaproteobacteria bacterium]MBU1654023.1 DUF1566 domain-containing protein [Gammaproteobacteria bacterium]MBU1959692.1 DUF1566 domain-containing protein [Gammaproteobacteria bacterium]
MKALLLNIDDHFQAPAWQCHPRRSGGAGLGAINRPLLAVLLLTIMTAAVSALESRPPGLDLTGPRIAAQDAAVAQAERAIEQKRLTTAGQDGPAALALLEGVLTSNPGHPGAQAALARLIGALAAHAEGLLAHTLPDLEGARGYWGKGRDLAVAWRISAAGAPLDRLQQAIEARGQETVRQAEKAAAKKALDEKQQALSAAEQAQTRLGRALEEKEIARQAEKAAAQKALDEKQQALTAAEEKLAAAQKALDEKQRALTATEVEKARLATENARLQAAQSQQGETAQTAPQGGAGRVTLRSQPRSLGDAEVKLMLKQRGYSDRDWHKEGKGLANDFVKNPNDTVTDRATGLMWQQGGSPKSMNYADAQAYVRQLNEKGFGGHNDWRLPTLEEAASLLEPKPLNGDLYIDPVFDQTQRWMWTADKEAGSAAVWLVSFSLGDVLWLDTAYDFFVRVCRASGQ